MTTAASKCLWVFSSFDESAAVARFAAVARATRGRIEHRVVSLDGNWSGEALISRAGGAWAKLDLPVRKKSILSISGLWAVRRVLAEEKPDLLVTSNGDALEWLMVNRGPGSAPHIHMEDPVGSEAEIDTADRNRNWARRRAFPGRQRLFVTGSEEIETAFSAQWGVSAAMVRRIGYGAPEGLFELPGSTTAAGEAVVFGAIAQGEGASGLTGLLRTVAELRGRGRNARAVIFGGGAMSAALRAEAERLALGDGFALLPLEAGQDALATAFESIDVYAALAGGEADARGVANAMAAGRPVLAASSDATAAALGELNRIFMRPGDDASALAASAELLCIDPDLRGRLGAENRKRAAAILSEERMAARFESVIAEFFDAPAPLMLPAPEKASTAAETAPPARPERQSADAAPREDVAARIALPAPADMFEMGIDESAPAAKAPREPEVSGTTPAAAPPAEEKPYRRRSAAELTREVLLRTRGELVGLAKGARRAEAG